MKNNIKAKILIILDNIILSLLGRLSQVLEKKVNLTQFLQNLV